MTRDAAVRAGCALLVLVGLSVAAGCSPPEGATPDEVARWLDDVGTEQELGGGLGAGTGPIDPRDPVPTDDQGITLEYPEPVHLEEVRLRCLGEGTLDITVRVARAVAGGETQSDARTYADVPCGTDGQVEAWAAQDVTGVTFSATGADRAGAWQGIALGEG